MGKMLLLQDRMGSAVEGVCIVKSFQVRTDSKDHLYADIVFCDVGGECVGKFWNYMPEKHGMYDPEDVVWVKGTLKPYKDTEQLNLESIHRLSEEEKRNFDMTRLVPCAPIEPEKLYTSLYRQAESFRDTALRELVTRLLDDNRERLIISPAAVKLHHAYRGGLLYHTYTVARLGKAVAGIYLTPDGTPKLNAELIIAGAILHDIGKLREMDTGKLGLASGYTDEGQLLGHIQIGIDLLHSAAEELDTPRETVMMLEHMLLSHHGVPEFGSPKYPMFPEAEVLSECDLMDARLTAMFDALEPIVPGGFTERIWSLDNRMLYKPMGNRETETELPY